jgi:hypothetical protein
MPNEHTHICAESDAAYPCPDPDQCQRTTALERLVRVCTDISASRQDSGLLDLESMRKKCNPRDESDEKKE